MKKQFIICAITLLSTIIFSHPSVANQTQQRQAKHLNKFLKKFDTNGDNKITKQEFDDSMLQRFKKMDVDNNSVITKEEFKNNSRAMHKGYKKNKMDTDNNGLVSKKAFLEAKHKWAERKFSKLDKNNDGFLSGKERTSEMLKFKKPRHYFSKIDKNNDGLISVEESKLSSAKLFKRLDQNNDKIITQDEIQSMSQKLKVEN